MTQFWQWLAGAGIERGLVGPREVGRLWERHLLNCAALSPLIPVASLVVDLGSGAGLPGLVLAVIRPDVRVICVDSMLRRTAFLEEVVADLELDNVEVRRSRAEGLGGRSGGRVPLHADVVTARAVGSLDQLARWAAPLLAKDGALVCLKGAAAVSEVRSAWPTLRSTGYRGSTDVLAVEFSESTSSPFIVSTVASWSADSTGPSEYSSAELLSQGSISVGSPVAASAATDPRNLGPAPAAVRQSGPPAAMTLATVVRVARSAG